MGYNELEIELRKILTQIARWREMGYMPTIEQGIALERLQKLYSGLLDLPCGEPEMQLETEEQVNLGVDEPVLAELTDQEVAIVEEEPSEMDGESDAQSENGEPIGVSTDIEVDGEGDDFPEFLGFSETQEEQSEQSDEHVSDETHLVQEYGSHDTDPQFEESAPEEVVWVEDKDGVEDGVEDNVAQDVETADQPPQNEPTEEVVPASEKPPRIFNIEVSPYARHEIIDTLFHGNTALFDVEAEKLDAMGSLEEALVYIGEMYHWIPENAATIKFIDLLETRFEE